MAKVSPIQPTQAGGAWSPIMEGRVDLERYGTAVRQAHNFVTIAQGVAMRRPGTRMVCPVDDHSKKSKMIPFEYSAEDAVMLAFSDGKMRVLNEDGPLIRASTAVTGVAANVLSSTAHGALVGEYVYLAGFDPASPLNFAIVKLTAATANTATFEAPTGYVTAPTLTGFETMARVFTMDTPYSDVLAQRLRYLQSIDVLYTFESTLSPRGIARYDTYDWRANALVLEDGPYLTINNTTTKLTPQTTGNLIPDPVDPTKVTTSGETVGFEGDLGGGTDPTQYWQADTNQAGWWAYEFPAPVVITRYVLFLPHDQLNATFSWKDYAPLNFTFEGWDGSAWVELDRQTDYALWDDGRSVEFPVQNTTAYLKYRVNITALTANGSIKPRLTKVMMMEAVETAATITFEASAVTGINGDRGFLSTDEGRVFRFKGSDGWWRWYRIEEVNSTLEIECRAYSDALPDLRGARDWRLGLWCDTTGWPTNAYFYADKMYIGGSIQAPDKLAYTVVGGYGPTSLRFSPTQPDGVVADDNGGVVTLNSKKVGAVRWIDSDERGLLVGTLNGEWTVRPADKTKAMSANNIEARNPTARGSSDVDPLHVDGQLLFVPRAGSSLREMSFNAAEETYQVPSMSLYASHFGTSRFKRLAFNAEPHSIAWVRRDDGKLLGFTYNREEGALGWHDHELGGSNTVIEDIAELPAMGGATDTVWFEVARTIGGQTRRYIEVMQPFWTHGFTLANVFFFDCGLVYEGEPTTTIYGLWHLEGQTVGLTADGAALPQQVVENGSVELPYEASRVVAGLMYDSECETLRPNAGASDGTAQGKTKRQHMVTFRLWESQGGQYTRPVNEEITTEEWVDFVHGEPDPLLDVAPPLFTGDYGPVEWQPGYDKEGTIKYRQPGHIGLPFNVLAIMPQGVTQDRG